MINEPTWRWLKHIFNREAASNCFATIEFQHLDGSPLFEKMDGRWSASLEIPDVIGQGMPISPNLLEPLRFREVYTNRREALTIAVKWDGEAPCHGFNSVSYFHPRFKNPAWLIPEGKFRVQVELSFAGKTIAQTFLIHNPRDIEKFRLEATPRGK